jgi:hypothetical protein
LSPGVFLHVEEAVRQAWGLGDHLKTVERGVGHAKRTPLKGLRFESLEQAQAYLDHWEERWADTRIHGTTKRQVAAMFEEERPALSEGVRAAEVAITTPSRSADPSTHAVSRRYRKKNKGERSMNLIELQRALHQLRLGGIAAVGVE